VHKQAWSIRNYRYVWDVSRSLFDLLQSESLHVFFSMSVRSFFSFGPIRFNLAMIWLLWAMATEVNTRSIGESGVQSGGSGNYQLSVFWPTCLRLQFWEVLGSHVETLALALLIHVLLNLSCELSSLWFLDCWIAYTSLLFWFVDCYTANASCHWFIDCWTAPFLACALTPRCSYLSFVIKRKFQRHLIHYS
jgi:hypothetical protein